MGRISEKFKLLKSKGEKALIPYISAGDPSILKTEELIYTLEKNGADIIELGIPYSDPLADGPVIEAAGHRSLANGFTLKDAFECVKNVRKNSQVPLIFMCYYNSVFGYGRDEFIENCVEAGIDGLIIPDLPLEEKDEIEPFLEGTGIDLIALAALTSKDRIPSITKSSKGFVYCVSSLGVTGERKSFSNNVDEFLKKTKESTDTPVCIGFGIGKKEDVERFKNIADGVIVGSALVRKIFETECDFEQVGEYIRELKSATK